MKPIRRIHTNRYLGELPRGCRLCMKGTKLVLFVTGLCGQGCFYCPLSEGRRGKDQSWANERPLRKESDLLLEARRMGALGAGITGGAVDLRLERTLRYIRRLKGEFGPTFHIHLYTASPLREGALESLQRGGLDEIRYHLREDEVLWDSLETALHLGLQAGAEVPVLPGREGDLLEIARRLEKMGGRFLNLNELEFSETNAEALRREGIERARGSFFAARGSRETALRVLEALRSGALPIHFCTARYKDSVQLRKRLLRTAERVSKRYEVVSREGLLLKGTVEIQRATPQRLEELRRILIRRFQIPEDLIGIDEERGRIETTQEVAEVLSRIYRRKGVSYSLIEEYPTYDRLVTEVLPLWP
jgi:hypothetical protein